MPLPNCQEVTWALAVFPIAYMIYLCALVLLHIHGWVLSDDICGHPYSYFYSAPSRQRFSFLNTCHICNCAIKLFAHEFYHASPHLPDVNHRFTVVSHEQPPLSQCLGESTDSCAARSALRTRSRPRLTTAMEPPAQVGCKSRSNLTGALF